MAEIFYLSVLNLNNYFKLGDFVFYDPIFTYDNSVVEVSFEITPYNKIMQK